MSYRQKFEYSALKTLPTSRNIFRGVPNNDLRAVVARNLGFFMNRPGCQYPNANALGIAAKVSPNTIRYLLHPSRRPVTASKPDGYPTLDKLEKIAQKLTCEVWELLHPNIEKSIRERAMYKKLEQDFKALPPVGAKESVA